MKSISTLVFSLLFAVVAHAQTANCNLELSIANSPSNDTFVVNHGDTVDIYLKILNRGPDALDTMDYVYFLIDGVPPGFYLVAEDSGTGLKVPLQVGEYFITHGLSYIYPTPRTTDTTYYDCFFLPYPSPNISYSDTIATNDTACFYVTFKGAPTSISKVKNQQPLKVYPNPANDFFTIELGNKIAEPLSLQVFNVVGQKVWEQSLSGQDRNPRIECSTWPKGMYHIQLKGAETLMQSKFMKL